MSGLLDDLIDVDRSDDAVRAWVAERVRRLDADARRSADTHLLRLELPARWGIELYLKDESTHVTGSLKHRLARSLFMYALVNGRLRPDMTVIEASSGSTAVSEAHFARMLDVPFVAVLPRSTSAAKIALIEREGGRCHVVDSADRMDPEARRLAADCGGLFMDQFTYAERATDWRGHNNIARSIIEQMVEEPHPVPRWMVVGAGTGGSSATLGRYLRYRRLPTGLCVADVDNSAFFEGWASGDPSVTSSVGSRIEGIGRPRVEPSFVPTVVDRMIRVPDAASVAASRFLSERLGRRVGASTGTNLVAVARLVAEMRASGEPGSVVTLLCDSGDRYAATYFDDAWVAEQGWELAPWIAELARVLPIGEH
ncbi:PLP-dependent cysteine synthase family protein [Brachybacterium huguangmaarense]|uniref:L-cysteine desulfhydrase Cds1 n=1 Tax=Brachybacterium huguangmaarense TaxID=1652028 RepID=A0ABY6G3D1_9MICO|nr:PLP-dependent cysteine synthase family protein [Brachybacterium huguangmaarense]UYG17714.1 PLP-dependent cysteine synthase family protein [Brachybacterium huguangmaarense]